MKSSVRPRVHRSRTENLHDLGLELKVRCDEAELKWKDGTRKGSVIWAEVDGMTMLIRSWKYVLN